MGFFDFFKTTEKRPVCYAPIEQLLGEELLNKIKEQECIFTINHNGEIDVVEGNPPHTIVMIEIINSCLFQELKIYNKTFVINFKCSKQKKYCRIDLTY